jgi:hypothetical protein
MRLIAIRVARQMLVRFVSAGAIHIALSATVHTLQPAVVFHAIDTLAAHYAPVVLVAGRAEDDDRTATSHDGQAPKPGFVGPGTGWG